MSLRDIEDRYSKALDAKPGKGPLRIGPVIDSVADIPVLVSTLQCIAWVHRAQGSRVNTERRYEPECAECGTLWPCRTIATLEVNLA